MNEAERLKWYDKEFRKISNQIKKSNSLSHYDFLRIHNYKLQLFSPESEKHISEITKEAFILAKGDKIIEAIKKLTELDGVGISMASAILAMKFSNFAIIDRRVLRALGKRNWLKNYKHSPEVYEDYLIQLRLEAKKKKMKLRKLEYYYFKRG